MRENRKKTMDMTRGPILRQIILFALPLLGSSLVQLLYNTVDLLYIGQVLGKNASAAVGASSMMVTCLVGLFGGLAVGAGVVTANAFGAKDRETVGKILHTGAALSILSGVLVFGLGYALPSSTPSGHRKRSFHWPCPICGSISSALCSSSATTWEPASSGPWGIPSCP